MSTPMPGLLPDEADGPSEMADPSTTEHPGETAEDHPARPSYPPAPRLDLVESLHGHQVADPYRWLEDTAGRTTPTPPSRDRRVVGRPGRSCSPSTPPAGRGATRVAGRIRALLGAGIVGVPVWRGDAALLRPARGIAGARAS